MHPHLRARMAQRGVTAQEIEETIAGGRQVADARPGTMGKAKVFAYGAEWEGAFFRQKEVIVYYKQTDQGIILLTVIARYGQEFPRE